MFKKLFSITVLGVSVSAPLLAIGCASDNAGMPYSVTGTTVDDQERNERLRWTDDKGHYRPDLRQRGGAPLHNIP